MSNRLSIFSNTWVSAIEHKARKHKYPKKYRECRLQVHDFSAWSNDVFSNYLRPHSNWQRIIFLHQAANSNLNLPPLLKFKIKIKIWLRVWNSNLNLPLDFKYQGCIKYESTARDKAWGGCMDEESYGPIRLPSHITENGFQFQFLVVQSIPYDRAMPMPMLFISTWSLAACFSSQHSYGACAYISIPCLQTL